MSRVLLVFFLLSLTILGEAHAEMKKEGTCEGKTVEGYEISFTYFSTFDGCHNKSKAFIAFNSGTEAGFLTGTRLIKDSFDHYSFQSSNWLKFAAMTGNTEGVYSYLLENGKRASVSLQCKIIDYEYEACE